MAGIDADNSIIERATNIELDRSVSLEYSLLKTNIRTDIIIINTDTITIPSPGSVRLNEYPRHNGNKSIVRTTNKLQTDSLNLYTLFAEIVVIFVSFNFIIVLAPRVLLSICIYIVFNRTVRPL